jgi:uncharacterized membrane protein YbaN (DUF454 family)
VSFIGKILPVAASTYYIATYIVFQHKRCRNYSSLFYQNKNCESARKNSQEKLKEKKKKINKK